MVSIMRRFQEQQGKARVMASMPDKGNGAKSLAKQSQRDALLAASLAEDLAVLSAERSLTRKAEIKRDTLIPKYAGYVATLRETGSDHELLGYYLVWLFDAGFIGQALEFASWCMENGLKLPEKFKSEIPFFVAGQVAAWAEAEFTAKREIEPYFSEVFVKILADEKAWALPDTETARFFRLRALKMEQDGNLQQAEADLVEASGYGAQVKTALERVRKNIKRQKEGEGGA